MKILEIVIYSSDGKKKRTVELNENGVTIISGKEKTGKTALSEIVQYCLGSECGIPEGIIRDNVSWYGIKLQFEKDQMFIARKNPQKKQQSTTKAIYMIKEKIVTPEVMLEEAETNIDDVVQVVTNKVGIGENLHKPDENHTRNDLEANIKHSLFYCFQDQNDIGTRKYLFHKQSDEFIPQAMRDTLPFLLGAIGKDKLQQENELYTKKRELSRIKKKKREEEAISGKSFEKAQKLFTQAVDIGLISVKEIKLDSLDDYKFALLKALNWKENKIEDINYDEVDDKVYKREILESKKREIDEKIASANRFADAGVEYYDELKIQMNRLESIGIYEKFMTNNNQENKNNSFYSDMIPNLEDIKKSLGVVNDELEKVDKERARLSDYLKDLRLLREDVMQEISLCQSEIDALYEQEEISKKYNELNTRRGIVLGKIMLWLESLSEIKEDSDLSFNLNKVEKDVERLEKIIAQEDIEDKIVSIINRIGATITKYSQHLELEHSDNPVRFDLKKLTVVADRPDKPITLEKMGGAANWVGYHLATHFALHKHFIEARCPVPRFLFLDQPSYAYFPEELKTSQEIKDEILNEEDRESITNLYNFIFEVVDRLEGKLQVIITDHVMINTKEFNNSLKEIWRKGQPYEALIPKDWYFNV